MRVFRGFNHSQLAARCALTIGSFDGVHRGHQAMLALLVNEARHRGVASCVLSFEPHPRDFFAARSGRPEAAPPRISTLRDKLGELERCGIDQVVVLRFDERMCALPAEDFVERVLVRGLNARYVLVGDDFRFGARRTGDYALLDEVYKQVNYRIEKMIIDINPEYPFAKSLVSSIIQGSLHQHFLKNHLKTITNCNDEINPTSFYIHLIENLLKK